MSSSPIGPPSNSYDHNALFDAFEAGWREAYQAMVLDPHTIRHEFEDWLRNWSAGRDH